MESRITTQAQKNKAKGHICEREGCENGHYAKGLCHYHYIDLLPASLAARGIVCIEEGCETGPWARGKCRRHYYKEYRRRQREKRAAARKAEQNGE